MDPPPGKSLHASAWSGLLFLAAAMGLALFGAAGTLRYWQAWVYLSVFTAASALITLDLMRRDPALLARRVRGGPTAEQRPRQKIIMSGATLAFIALLVVPALDHRFRWSAVSAGVALAGDALVAIVRHPMYSGGLVLLLGTPLAPGSYRGLAAFAAMVVLLLVRLSDEEEVLATELPGYVEYRNRVRHRLVPFLW